MSKRHLIKMSFKFSKKDFCFDSFHFPTMQMIGEDLVTVLDFLHVKYVIGLGEGAGANILLRFGMAHASRCLGLILVNVTAGKTSVMDYFKDKVHTIYSHSQSAFFT